jgi:transposase-like protein
MSKVIMRCPKCGAETRFHLIDSIYEGPYRCWKCRALFTVRVEDDEVKSYEPLSEEELEE